MEEPIIEKPFNLSAPTTPQIPHILKCPECFNIPEIIEEYNGFYEFKCRNKHSERLELKELLNKCSILDTFYKCSYGKETNLQDEYLFFFFCFKCKKVICSEKKCQKAHMKECGQDSDKFIPCKNLISLCYEHGEKLFFYCPKCDINICEKCEGHEEHNIKFMNQMKIDEKEMKLYNYKIEFCKNYMNYIEKEINQFKKDWREDFERNMKHFEERAKYFLEKNRTQIELIENILNTYKIKGNVCIENYKNIKTFCKINEFKFKLPYGINEKKKYIEDFFWNFIINERKGGNKISGKKAERKKESKPFQIKNADQEIVSKVLKELNNLFEINKIEKEEKIRKGIEYILNDYLSKNEIYSNNYYWYEEIIYNNIWDLINYLPNL